MPLNDVAQNLSPANFAGLLRTEVIKVEKIDGGLNSRAFEVTVADGTKYAAKLYPGPTADGQSRMAVEFSALEFLHARGIECVPKPIVSDGDRQCAVFEFVEGGKVPSHEVTKRDIDQATQFLVRLKDLGNGPDYLLLPSAAEACFSVQAIVGNLESRLARLQAIDASSEITAEARDFLAEQFIPAFRRTVAWSEERVAGSGISMDSELSLESRTLSPSDFGFHNALRRSDGELVFLDFEYFGWDDPAKMISDFLLHPAMELSASLKSRFVENMINNPGKNQADPTFIERFETVFPLFGLKWCLILLNAFLPQYRIERGITETPDSEPTKLLEWQLEKARTMLSTVEKEYERFPYRDEEHTVNVT